MQLDYVSDRIETENDCDIVYVGNQLVMCSKEISKTVLPNSFYSKDTVKLVLMVRNGEVT